MSDYIYHPAMTPSPGEARLSKKMQDTLRQLRQLVIEAREAETRARGLTEPETSLHYLRRDKKVIGLGNETVFFRQDTGLAHMDESVIRCEILREYGCLSVVSHGDPLLVRSFASNSIGIYAADPYLLRQHR